MTNNDPYSVLHLIAQAIFDKKGANILALDLRGVSTMTDFVVIAEGHVDRHVIAIAKGVKAALHGVGMRPAYVEGMETGDWIVLDYLHCMIHLFMPGLRDKFQLEALWQEGDIVDVAIDVESKKSI